MGVTNYFSVDGEVIAESGASGYLSYHRDNLGSVCATLDSSGALVHQYQYKPFGEHWSASGAGAQDRRLQWCGSWGYSAIALTRKFLSYYVRARHYAAILGNWTSVDPLWPSEMAYGYVENRVMTGVDYWGMQVARMDSFRQWGNKVFPPNGDWGVPIIRGGPVWYPGIGSQPGSAQGRTRPALVGGVDPVNDWAYGDYCGKNNWKRGCKRPIPKDCVDSACQIHDDCLELNSYASLGGSTCHCYFLNEVMRCLDHGGCGNSKYGVAGILECYEAAIHIISVFSLICPGTQFTGLVGLFSRKGRPTSVSAPTSNPYGGFENPKSVPGAVIPKPGGGVIRV